MKPQRTLKTRPDIRMQVLHVELGALLGKIEKAIYPLK